MGRRTGRQGQPRIADPRLLGDRACPADRIERKGVRRHKLSSRAALPLGGVAIPNYDRGDRFAGARGDKTCHSSDRDSHELHEGEFDASFASPTCPHRPVDNARIGAGAKDTGLRGQSPFGAGAERVEGGAYGQSGVDSQPLTADNSPRVAARRSRFPLPCPGFSEKQTRDHSSIPHSSERLSRAASMILSQGLSGSS
jgi:hypothetical protein